MKKITILLCGGLFALTSCNDSIYEEIDEQNNDMYAPSSFNNNDPGHAHGDDPGSGIIWAGGNYFSPWDIWLRENDFGPGDLQPAYVISNGHDESFSNYNLEVFAYIGLAYFDSDDDGSYDDPSLNPFGPPVPVADLTNGNYPNLYANGHEVGNLVKTVVPITSQGHPSITSGLRIEGDPTTHLLTPIGTDRYPWLSQSQLFDFAGSITPDEEDLLRQYGKVFFYEVNVYDKFTNAPVLLNHIMHPKIETIHDPNADWVRVRDQSMNPIQGTIPLLGTNVDLYYYYANLPGGTDWLGPNIYTNPGKQCDSREVVFDIDPLWLLHETPLSASSTLKLEIWSSSQYLWVNSFLRLSIEN